MESALTVFERPVNGVGANNAVPLRETQQEEIKMSAPGSRGHWTESQDLKLKELVEAHGLENWDLIAKEMQTRTPKSCRVRWFNQVDPTLNRAPFTLEEEDIIISTHSYYGNQWAKIAKHLKGRSENDVKKHWNHYVNRPAWRSHTKTKKSFFTATLNPYGYHVPGLCLL
ncbi:hypothetical protein CARUB_v10006761mg [Capsella rubella]|uniref:Uncharacterized protein n=1 Tax=Capsella rubella TaxID=81985 RepID=R0H408_9BRAS|nr:hypothetical protein CARUB_v10006761mg [Capsella rubella]